MDLYYVEIRSTFNDILLHAELIMTHSKENAEAIAREHMLDDCYDGARILISQNTIETITTSELITDVNTLGKGKTPYYTYEAIRKCTKQ